jgi:hypothetical protein
MWERQTSPTTQSTEQFLASMAIMKPVLSTESEAEIGALIHNCKKATMLCITLHEIATPMQTDNSTACGIANNNIKQQ